MGGLWSKGLLQRWGLAEMLGWIDMYIVLREKRAVAKV